MASLIKGGQAVLRPLDTSVYNAEARPKAWIATFGSCPPSEQVEGMSKMFQLLEDDERQMVVAQLA